MTRVFKLKSTTVHERFGDESVIVNLETGSYYSVQGTGDAIWNLLASGASETEILASICAEYKGDHAEIVRVTTSFLDQLVQEALVDLDDRPSARRGPVPTAALAQDKVFVLPVLQKYTDMEELLLLDPIHEVDEAGWPSARKAPE